MGPCSQAAGMEAGQCFAHWLRLLHPCAPQRNRLCWDEVASEACVLLSVLPCPPEEPGFCFATDTAHRGSALCVSAQCC